MTKRHAALYASLAGDALSLGSHWIYNQSKIARLYPDGITGFDDPHTDYHQGKRAGDFTHYGDQALVLLRSLVLRRGWNQAGFREDWAAMWPGSTSYRDGATKTTLQNFADYKPAPSDSNDLAGASRLAPIVAALADAPLEDKIDAARTQTAVTHGDGIVIDSAEYFVRAVEAVLGGSSIPDALTTAAEASYNDLPVADWLTKAREAAGQEPVAALANLGLTCHVPEAFPATVALALRFSDDLPGALVTNVMAGGDSAARGLVLGLLLGAAHGFEAIPSTWINELSAHRQVEALLTLLDAPLEPDSKAVSFPSATGVKLDARLELPPGPVRGVALFAHCFTCGKNIRAAVRIARALASEGIATLRFDFTGLGSSEGDFANTSFITNVDDLMAAADYLRQEIGAPTILVGHSLGGAAVLAAAGRIPEARGIVTIGAPADPEHVTHLLGGDLSRLESEGVADITLGGRSFRIGARFLEDLRDHCQPCEIAKLGRDLLIMHAPNDEIVGIDNARKIYDAAKHPKSFLSLAGADHLLTDPTHADFAARLIETWAGRLL